MTSPLTIAQLNALPLHQAIAKLADIYEHSPWIAERALANRPFANPPGLARAMRQAVTCASLDEQLGLLRAHPQLAGKEARDGSLTVHSTAEQKGAGLVNLSDAEKAEINMLNHSYQGKFGFPFIIAVRKHARSGIFDEFRRRTAGQDTDAERRTCLEQVHDIALLRIEALFAA